MLLNHLSEIVVLDIADESKIFQDAIAPVPPGINNDATHLIIVMLELLDNFYMAETMVAAAVYEFWNKHPEFCDQYMERYTDAMIALANNVQTKMDLLNLYNSEGEALYVYDKRLGQGIVLRLKALNENEYQLF